MRDNVFDAYNKVNMYIFNVSEKSKMLMCKKNKMITV